MRPCEVLIVPPNAAVGLTDDFVARCVMAGVDFHFDPGDRLPSAVPDGAGAVKAIVIEHDLVERQRDLIEKYVKAGARVYRMNRDFSPTVPNATLSWGGELTFQTICFDAGLTLRSDAGRARMLDRCDEDIFRSLIERLLNTEMTRWYDAARYQWESLLLGYLVTDDARCLDKLDGQIRNAITNVPNDLSNCDTVAPLIPMLQLHKLRPDDGLLNFARKTFDRYLEVTPKCEGSLVNFGVYPNSVRSEILWQVLPGLALLAECTKEDKYYTVLAEQFERQHALLFDPKLGLWHHGYNGGRHTAAFWARGVAFGCLGNLLVLDSLPTDSPVYSSCKTAFTLGADRLRRLQQPDGFWTAIVDDPKSGNESSGTAWICTAFELAIRRGHLDAGYRAAADLAYEAVKTRCWAGNFPGHMAGTTASMQPEYYSHKPFVPTGWAHFAAWALGQRALTLKVGKR